MDIILIAFAVVVIFAIVSMWNQKKVPNNTIIAFTGGLGSGKTFMAVKQATKHYRRNIIRWYVQKLTSKIFIINKFTKRFTEKPAFYSNIPVRVSVFPFVRIWARQLRYEHLTLQSRIEEYSTVLIDEIGHFASQYEYDHPLVQQYIQEFIRFFRHYIDGKLILTDQSSSNIVISIRRRINQIYNLSDFRRYFLFFYRINVSEIHITEDMLTIQQTTELDEIPFFFGLLPFKWFKLIGLLPSYDSRCYSINYKADFSKTEAIWSALKTNYFIDLPNSPEMKKIYKTKGYLTDLETNKLIHEWKTRQVKLPDSSPLASEPKANDNNTNK